MIFHARQVQQVEDVAELLAGLLENLNFFLVGLNHISKGEGVFRQLIEVVGGVNLVVIVGIHLFAQLGQCWTVVFRHLAAVLLIPCLNLGGFFPKLYVLAQQLAHKIHGHLGSGFIFGCLAQFFLEVTHIIQVAETVGLEIPVKNNNEVCQEMRPHEGVVGVVEEIEEGVYQLFAQVVGQLFLQQFLINVEDNLQSLLLILFRQFLVEPEVRDGDTHQLVDDFLPIGKRVVILVEEVGNTFVDTPVVVAQRHEPLVMIRNGVGYILCAREVGLQRL